MRALFDLDARPDLIAAHLRRDAAPGARPSAANPGLRVPGAFNGFEMGLRAILGQQVTVKAATTIACRFVEAFGEPIVTPFPELNRLTPAAGARRGRHRGRDRPARHRRRARQEHHRAGRGAADPASCASTAARIAIRTTSIQRLAELPGIGQWTAHYIAMRALRWPDAFPKEDIAVRNRLGGVTRQGGGRAVAGVAPVAQLRRHAHLGDEERLSDRMRSRSRPPPAMPRQCRCAAS